MLARIRCVVLLFEFFDGEFQEKENGCCGMRVAGPYEINEMSAHLIRKGAAQVDLFPHGIMKSR